MYLSALVLLFCLTVAPAFASRPDSVPDWVRTAAQQKLPDYPPETNAVVLLEDTTYTVAPDGSAVEHHRHVIKILRPQGRREAIVGVPFDKDTKILSMHVWSIGPDGHEYAVKDNEMVEHGYGDAHIFEDDKVRIPEAPGRDPGGIVAFEYEQRCHPYLTEKTWFFQDGLPHLNQSCSDDQLAALFVAMARAAGFKAYLGSVTSRDRNLFIKNYLTLSQLDDAIAIVNVDGKNQFFDPGTRFCPYSHLAWKHTYAAGIRQVDGGSDYFNTSGEPYTFSRTLRVANLALSPQGAVTGGITMTYLGDPAIHWRQRAIEGDAASLEREIRTSVERLMPPGIELKVTSIDKLDDYEQPLVANLEVKGTLGSSTGKRVLLPGDIFEANAKPSFPQAKRDIPVYFQYPHMTQDAVRIRFPATLAVESLPAADKTTFEKSIAYALSAESAPDSFTVRRNYILGDILYQPPQYTNFRAFYSKMENKDQESVVLTAAKAAPAGN